MEQNYRILKLIQILDYNSRTTTKEISKETDTSQQNVSNYIKKLESNKIIKKYPLLVDSSKFGFVNFCVFLRVKRFSKTFLNELTNELKKYKEITCIDFVFGNFDIFLRFTTPNASNFNKTLREILQTYSKDISNYEILNQVVMYNYPSNFLSRKVYTSKSIISGDRDMIEIDTVDKKILNFLNENSRSTAVDIARKVKITPKTVITRMKNLERGNIIRGYSLLIDHKKLNFYRYYLSLKFDFVDEENEKKFIKFAQNSQNTVELIRVFGKWDILLTIITKNPLEFREILFTIKEEFFEYLEDYSFLESEEVRLMKYIPELEI